MRTTRVRTLVVAAALLLALPALVPTHARAQTAPPGGWQYNATTGHLYMAGVFDRWTDAEASAVGLGGHLVDVNDAAEQFWLDSTFGDLGYWIGLNDRATEGVFVWTSGAPLTYSRWIMYEPNDMTTEACPQGEDVVQREWEHLFGEGWNDVCDLGFGGWAVIEMPLRTYLVQMVEDGDLPNAAAVTTIERLAAKSETGLTRYLAGMVRSGRITQATADDILTLIVG